jgi:hypothetical protein
LDALSAAVLTRPKRDDERDCVGVVGKLARNTVVGITVGQEARWSSGAGTGDGSGGGEH